jgi:hypothetical protein
VSSGNDSLEEQGRNIMFLCIGVVVGLMFLCTLCAWINARYLTRKAKDAEHLSKAEARVSPTTLSSPRVQPVRGTHARSSAYP